jgi:cytochrome c-type biogenesis protein CcmH
MKRQLFCVVIMLSALVAFVPQGIGYAQDTSPITDDQVNALAEELYCPVCENVPLDVCPTQACAQWRDLIREKMELGWSEPQIKEFFALQYGDQVLAVPPRRGFNWLIYVLPPIIILSGIVIAVRFVSRSKTQPLPAVEIATPADHAPLDSVINEIEQDLKRKQ